MISKRKRSARAKSTMEGGHMLNKLHTKGTMKQQDQGSKDKKRDALQCRAEIRKTKCKSIEMHSHVMCLQTIENKSMLMHSNHRPKPMLPIMKLNQISKENSLQTEQQAKNTINNHLVQTQLEQPLT